MGSHDSSSLSAGRRQDGRQDRRLHCKVGQGSLASSYKKGLWTQILLFEVLGLPNTSPSLTGFSPIAVILVSLATVGLLVQQVSSRAGTFVPMTISSTLTVSGAQWELKKYFARSTKNTHKAGAIEVYFCPLLQKCKMI